MWRGSDGWVKIMHVFGGQIQHSLTQSGKSVRRINPIRKGRGVGGNGSAPPPPSFIFIIFPESVDRIHSFQYQRIRQYSNVYVHPVMMGKNISGPRGRG